MKSVERGPMFASATQMAERTGIPKSIIIEAKHAGCEGFDAANRCYLYPVLRWFFSQDADHCDWGNELKKWKAKREKIATERDQEKLVNRDLVNSIHVEAMSAMFSGLRKFSSEYPPRLKGLTEIQIQNQLETMNQQIEERVRAAFRKLEKQKDTKNE